MMMVSLLVIVAVLLVRETRSCQLAQLKKWAASRLKELRGNKNVDACEILSLGRPAHTGKQDRSPPHVQAFLFQQDEEDLLSDWLSYHSFMFGLHNIHVIDHQSESEEVCKTLALFVQCGVNVVEYKGDFQAKWVILSKVMKGVKGADFLLSLDADEFVVARDGTEVEICPWALRRAFAELPMDGRKYKYLDVMVKYGHDTCHSNNVTRRVTEGAYLHEHRTDPMMVKTFFPAQGFIQTDQGNHWGRVKHDAVVKPGPNRLNEAYVFTNISLLHFNVPTHRGMGAKMRRGAQAYGYDSHTNCTGKPGGHYCTSAEEFRKQSPASFQSFYTQCLAEPNVPYMDRFAQWFKRHVPTMAQLVGSDQGANHTTWVDRFMSDKSDPELSHLESRSAKDPRERLSRKTSSASIWDVFGSGTARPPSAVATKG